MRGRYQIVVKTRKIQYSFWINRNITIIQGDSARGKTVLVDLIREYQENGNTTGVEVICERECVVISGNRNWQENILRYEGKKCIIFIDEGKAFVSSEEFAKLVKSSDNYFVLVTRENLYQLPYSVREIYTITERGKYRETNAVLNEFERIYQTNSEGMTPAQLIVTEDKNAGYTFIADLCNTHGIKCTSAEGNSNIESCIVQREEKKVTLIVDGAAFGAYVNRVYEKIKASKSTQYTLIMPESFEYLLLRTKLIPVKELNNILLNTWDYVESSKYFSWERYFNDLLTDVTKNTIAAYNKDKLNNYYRSEKFYKRVLQECPELAKQFLIERYVNE